MKSIAQWHLLINSVPACESPKGNPHCPPCVFSSHLDAIEAVRMNRQYYPYERYQIVPGPCPAWKVRLDV